MIKLTDDEIEVLTGGISMNAPLARWRIARAIEAEILRLNGDAVATERAACAALCSRLYEEGLADGYECEQAILARGNPPRATGCPDTMDDTARFAVEEFPAIPGILRKQAG